MIGDWGAGATPSRSHPEYYQGDIPWLKTGDLTDGYITSIPESISALALEKTSVKLNPAGSILMAMYGATIGKLGILAYPATTNQACCACFPYNGILNLFLFYYLMGQRESFIKKGEGGAQPNISKEKIVASFIAIPPAQEQLRIVASIASLLPLVDNYKKTEQELASLNKKLPDFLKKSILQYAIQGKLVPQDPTDEPASVLLERIAKERAKKGKKAAKSMSRIERRDRGTYEIFPDGSEKDISEEIPFDIPDSWEWSRLGHICINRDSERIPLSSTQREKQQKLYDYYGASGVIDKVESYLFDTKLLLIGEDGANLINRSTDIAFFAEGKYWVNNHAHVLDSFAAMPLDFLSLYINSISLAPFVTGTAQPKLNQERLNAILVPVPPYSEQQRIVDSVLKYTSLIAL